MPVQDSVADRTGSTTEPTEPTEPTELDLSAIRIVEVPQHWPSTDWPSEHWLPAGSTDEDTGPDDATRATIANDAQAWQRQFAVLLTEALAGVRPARQLLPWLSDRGSVHLHRLLPLFADGQRPHLTRVLTTRPAKDVIEMTLVITAGQRTRALAVRLERTCPAQRPRWREKPSVQGARPGSSASAQWRCTDIEAP